MDIHSMFDVVSYSEQTFLTIYSRLGLCLNVLPFFNSVFWNFSGSQF